MCVREVCLGCVRELLFCGCVLELVVCRAGPIRVRVSYPRLRFGKNVRLKQGSIESTHKVPTSHYRTSALPGWQMNVNVGRVV